METKFLLIDDVRDIEADYIARTAEDALYHLKNSPVTHVYLDNDLGDDQPMEGIDILQWARDNGCVPDNVQIVSSNPVARKRMEDVLRYDLQYRNTGHWWRKS